MFPQPSPALSTVRGFNGTPAASGDDDSDFCLAPALAVTNPSRKRPKRPKRKNVLNDVVSSNCSPLLKPVASPSGIASGIAKLRLQLDTLTSNSPGAGGTATSSRASSMMFPENGSHPFSLREDSATESSRPVSRSTLRSALGLRQSPSGSASSDETALDATTRFEIEFRDDFVNDAEEPTAVEDVFVMDGNPRQPLRQKITADDFEPLRYLGKGTYGTVLLVKQRSTGRLYAQKQFKKASLVVHKKLVEQTKTERQILESVNRHPFVVNLYYAFQDQEKLYLILEYGQGGELFTHLSTERMFSEETAAFYMAEMVLALAHLHANLGVVYRDLKPENCLLDADGHLLLTDFGLSKVAVDQDECNSILGTVEYMAPEIIQGKKYGKAVDWWSLGALGYDLVTGNPPFRGANHARIQDNIVKQKLVLPFFLSADAKDLLTRMLRKDPAKRLGSVMPRDLATIKKHRFFRKIDWKKLAARELTPPIRPVITNPELAENFSPEFTDLCLSPLVSRVSDEPWGTVGARDAARDDLFSNFSFVAPSSLLEGLQIPG